MIETLRRQGTSCRNHNALREPRQGILLHYDDSSSDDGALAWFTDPRCDVSYNYLVLRDGTWAQIVAEDRRAWHAGVCRPSDPRHTYTDANSALIGVAIAHSGTGQATPRQLVTTIELCTDIWLRHGWRPEELWRLTGHDREAWPRGRKIDPTGPDPSSPVLSVLGVRAEVARRVLAK